MMSDFSSTTHLPPLPSPRTDYEEALTSCMRTISLASPDMRLAVFKTQSAEAVALAIMFGIDPTDGLFDALYERAVSTGIVETHGEDVVQHALSAAMSVPPRAIGPLPSDDLVIRRLSDVQIEAVEQLWPSRFYIGKQSLLIGEQGIGKSQLTCFIAAAVTNGSAWPCDEGRAPQGSVIFLRVVCGWLPQARTLISVSASWSGAVICPAFVCDI